MALNVRRSKITPYNVFILFFVGLGSMTYGYTASIIGTTLGTFPAYQQLLVYPANSLQANQHLLNTSVSRREIMAQILFLP